MSAENKALMRRWFEEVWSRGNAAAIDEMLSTRVVVHGLGDNVQDMAGFKQFHTMYRSAFPDVRIQVDDVIAEGDKVAVRWSGAGTHRGTISDFRRRGPRFNSPA
jgi:predicted ester cyclase